MKQTQNRKAIIKCLTERNDDCGGCPPFSAASIHYMLEGGNKWYGAEKTVNISQIHRTLRDLLAVGLVVYEMRLDDAWGNGKLPQRVKYWQMADAADRNKLINAVYKVCKLASKAHGTFLFTRDRFFDQPMNAEQKNAIIKDLKGLMQKTHPDKFDGFVGQFKQLQESLAYVRSNVDLLSTPVTRLR